MTASASASVDEGQGQDESRLSFRSDPAVTEAAAGGGPSIPAVSEPADDENDDAVEGDPSPPLRSSSRLKGYIALFVSSLFNYLEAANWDGGINADNLSRSNLCPSLDHLGLRDLIRPTSAPPRRGLEFAMACSMITVVVTGVVILCHLDCCTPLRKNVWPKAFGPHSKFELAVLLSLTLLWFASTWFNTTVRGPAGDGSGRYNLYFTNWTCCWTCFWTLERWSTASGRASFEAFVRSWPNRTPLWIVSCILGLADFLFALDAARHWEEGTAYNPYLRKIYSGVSRAEWALVFFVTFSTFAISLAWVLAEIFRESRTNVGSVKSDVENYVEGLTAQALAFLWIVTVCIVTMPGGLASLLGNLYFTTWSTLFAVISTLIWYLRDWRRGIANAIREEEEKYELTKLAIRRREEARLARLEEKEEEDARDPDANGEESRAEEEDDDGTLCQDDPVEEDITLSIASDYDRPRLGTGASSLTSGRDRSRSTANHGGPHPPIAPSGATPPSDSDVGASTGVFASLLSYFYPQGLDEMPP